MPQDFIERRKSTCPSSGCREPELAASEAADKAVRQVFAILGVNIDEPKEVENFRDGLRFGQSMLKLANRGIIAFVVVLASGAAVALLLGIKVKLVGH